jgi:broad specificity phosphatase PhoE
MPEILDAPLTHKGREQAILLQSTVRALKDKPELVVFSPNCRALQTGMLAFQELDEKVPFIAHECVREETGVHMCDKRRPKSQQAKEFPRIDFSELETEHDAIFDENVRETKLQLVNRIYKFLEWLEARDEKHVGVSSHSAFLLTLFNANLVSDDDKLKDWFQTGEMRSAVLEFVRT